MTGQSDADFYVGQGFEARAGSKPLPDLDLCIASGRV